MSYDLWLEIDTGGEEPAPIADLGNHTWNCNKMFAEALGAGTFYDLNGKNAGETIAQLEEAVRRMKADPEHYRAMNPANGWGSYETALEYLRRTLTACRAHPLATIRLS